MENLNNLVIYKHARNAIFKQETGEYSAEHGWIKEDVQATVIGEDDNIYVTRTFTKSSFMLRPGVSIYGDITYGIGFHKTRLVKFLDTQLKLEI